MKRYHWEQCGGNKKKLEKLKTETEEGWNVSNIVPKSII